MTSSPKLTTLSSCAGCAAKLDQQTLAQLLGQLPPLPPNPNLLIGAATADDAAVYRLNHRCALVQTVDFFTPIVDDPFAYGQVAAANAISDVYAMGGRPLTALNLLGFPADLLSAPTIAAILRGGLTKALEAHCTVVGGHTIRLPEPVYGLAVTGLVSPRRLIANSAARPGDWLVLTKPLGTGIVTTALKRGLASPSLQRKTLRSMTTLNSVGAHLAEAGLVRAGTDVTGFGLLGHLANLCRASHLGAELHLHSLPALDQEVFRLIEQDCIPGGSRKNLEIAAQLTDWGAATQIQKHLLTDAQTSGGLLLCVAPKHLPAVLNLLRSARTPCAAVLGRIVPANPPRIALLAHSPARNGHRHRPAENPKPFQTRVTSPNTPGSFHPTKILTRRRPPPARRQGQAKRGKTLNRNRWNYSPSDK